MVLFFLETTADNRKYDFPARFYAKGVIGDKIMKTSYDKLFD
jgi:hypothetical protein